MDGKLTREEIWILPSPDVEEMLSADLADQLRESGDLEYIAESHPNYQYTFGSGEDGVLTVTLDLDYLFYPEEGEENAVSGTVYDIDYGWSGERLVRQDFDALDDVQMRAIGLMLGFQPEEFYVENGGFKTFDPEEESDNGQDYYYNYVQTYTVTDEIGMASAWKVLVYDLGMRELKVYDFDGTRLAPAADDAPVAEWDRVKASHPYAFVWLSDNGLSFREPRGEYADYAFVEYAWGDNAFTLSRSE